MPRLDNPPGGHHSWLREDTVLEPPHQPLDFKGSDLGPCHRQRHFAAESLLWLGQPALRRLAVAFEQAQRAPEKTGGSHQTIRFVLAKSPLTLPARQRSLWNVDEDEHLVARDR